MALSVIIDIILVAILLIGAVIGIKKGLFITLSKPIKLFLALFLAFQLCNWFAGLVVEPLIEAPIANKITTYLVEKCNGITSIEDPDKLPTLLKIAAGIVGVDVATITADTTEAFVKSLVDALAVPAIHVVSVVISFVILYFVSKLLLKLVFAILNSFVDSGILGVVNRILGFVFNTVFAFIVAWALVAIFSYILNIPAIASAEWADFEGGFVYKFFRSMSPLDLLLSF